MKEKLNLLNMQYEQLVTESDGLKFYDKVILEPKHEIDEDGALKQFLRDDNS